MRTTDDFTINSVTLMVASWCHRGSISASERDAVLGLINALVDERAALRESIRQTENGAAWPVREWSEGGTVYQEGRQSSGMSLDETIRFIEDTRAQWESVLAQHGISPPSPEPSSASETR
jgi:hypothetical protein